MDGGSFLSYDTAHSRPPPNSVVRGERLKKSTLFEMEPSPELEAVQNEYLRLAASLWVGSEPYDAMPMKDRDVFDFLGFE